MFDRTSPGKEVMDSISEMIGRSVPKDEIFRKTSENFPGLDKDAIARGIASFIPSDSKKRYRIHSYLLSLILIISFGTYLFASGFNAGGSNTSGRWIFNAVFIILISTFINGFMRFKLWFYTTAVSYYSIALLWVIYQLFVYPFNDLVLLSSAGMVITLVYLYFIRKSIFPNITFWGNVKQENGKYVF